MEVTEGKSPVGRTDSKGSAPILRAGAKAGGGKMGAAEAAADSLVAAGLGANAKASPQMARLVPELSGKFRVLIVDDHPITRQGVRALIERERNLEVCGEADNAPRAIELVVKLVPHVAIVDISLKSTSGIELIKNLKALSPALPILVMSMHDESIYAERALRAGAQGYVMKQEASEKIIAAIHRLLAGELFLSDAMREKMLHRMVNAKKEETGFSVDKLSDREMEVLQLIGNGFGTRQIAARLNLSVKTIDSYREHLKLKLLLNTGSDLVRYAIQWVRSHDVELI